MYEIKTYQHKVGEKLRLSEDSIPDAEFVTVNLEPVVICAPVPDVIIVEFVTVAFALFAK